MVLTDQKDSLTKQKQFELDSQKKQFRDNVISYKLLSENQQLKKEREEQNDLERAMARKIEEGMIRRSQEFIQKKNEEAFEKKMQNKAQMDSMLSEFELKKLKESAENRRKAMEHQRDIEENNKRFENEQNRRKQSLQNRLEKINQKQRMYEEQALVQQLEREQGILTKIERDELIAQIKARQDEENRRRMKQEVRLTLQSNQHYSS